MRFVPLLATLLAVAGPTARADGPVIDGEYESPLGRVRVVGKGGTFRGVLVAASDICGFREGEDVLRATLLDDSLAGQVRVCLGGKGCRAKEEWSSAVLLASGERLSGALHVATKACKAPLGKNGGLAFVRVAGESAPRPAPPVPEQAPVPGKTTAPGALPARSADAEPQRPPRRAPDRRAREQARALLRDGGAWLSEGNFESARRRFLEALELDADIPEAYNGVGVTFRMRNDLAHALEWYKKALAVDPDFGDAYYNMACIYALEGKKDMALRYLQIAALNGYATAEGIDGDPDLERVRDEPGYRALVRQRM
jgi:tetratricopeptide (TPR) repeat protein